MIYFPEELNYFKAKFDFGPIVYVFFLMDKRAIGFTGGNYCYPWKSAPQDVQVRCCSLYSTSRISED